MRVAYLVSAAMPGVLPHAPMRVERGQLKLRLKGRFGAIEGERVFARLRQLARLVGREPVMVTE
jgi:exopolyphosphatase/guanosine-5'-triphosphate,3'-diphosphate pyrophosphatase